MGHLLPAQAISVQSGLITDLGRKICLCRTMEVQVPSKVIIMQTTTEYYKANPDKYSARKRQIRARQREIRRIVQEYRRGKVCSYCGFDDYRAIDFHHRDASNKIVNPSLIYTKGWGWEKVQEELDKCDPVCKNCHAIIHHPDTSV